MASKNKGKLFEEDWKNSCPDNCWIYRLKDTVASFVRDENIKFAKDNICDFVMFDDETCTLLLVELKSTKSTNIPFWRDGMNEKGCGFMIKSNQIKGLRKASKHNLVAGFVLNFRAKDNKTYFLSIQNFDRFVASSDKSSINLYDVVNFGGIEIDNHKKISRYSYDVEKLIVDINKK